MPERAINPIKSVVRFDRLGEAGAPLMDMLT